MASPGNATIVGTAQGVVQGDHNTVTLNFDYRGATLDRLDREPAAPRRLPPPVNVLPAPFARLLDRTEPVADTFGGLAAGLPVEISGPPGIGKSALLRYLCRRLEVARFDGGVVFKEQRREPVDDLLQFLFDAFYDAEAGFKPVGARLLRYLEDIPALVVLDDLTLDQENLETLRNSASSCSFVLATERIQLLEAKAVTLGGLPEDAIPALIERGLGRSLAVEELPAVGLLNRALGGNPRHLLQAAALVRQGSTTLSDLAARLGSGGGATHLAQEVVAAASPAERGVLRTLAALGDVPVQAGHVEALSAVPGAATMLESLRERQLVQVHSPTYTVADNVGAALQAEADPVVRSTAVVDHLTRWIQSQQAANLLEDRELVLAAIGWASEAGRWREVLRLCRGIEGALMAAGRWGEWQLVLEQAVVAARQVGDQLAVGWALHQLGTLALCREDYGAAQSLLGQAVAVRERAGDAEGALVTRHNLEVLAQLIAPPGPGSPPSMAARILGWKLLLLIPLVAASAGVAIATSRGRLPTPPPSVSPSPASVTVSSDSNRHSPTPNTGTGQSTPGAALGGSTATPRVVLDLKELNLGNHFPGEPKTVKTVTVKNEGAVDATISDVRATGEFSPDSHCSGANAKLRPGQSCKIDVQFGPTTPGQKSGQLMISDTAGGHTAALIGCSRLPLQLNPNPVDFGKVPVSSSNTVWMDATLTNLTGVSQSYGGSTSPSAPFRSQSNCFASGSLPPHGSCVITFAFSPRQLGQVQVVGATVTDAYSDEYDLQLTGVGIHETPPPTETSPPTVPTLPTVTPLRSHRR